MTGMKGRMLRGELYVGDEELRVDHGRAQELLER